jgi:hypothetical protein|tara:strand:- start:19 stop:228 length:210 start_codon:yes stop_codon:yes gene_type:complete
METKHIQIHDLANALTLIDFAANKGLIGGDQLSIMGAMRSRFESELKEQAPAEDNVSDIDTVIPKSKEL